MKPTIAKSIVMRTRVSFDCCEEGSSVHALWIMTGLWENDF